MTKQTMIKNYRKYTAANGYIFVFTFQHKLYFVKTAEIMPRWINESYNSSSSGGGRKIVFYLPVKDKERFVKKGAICLGSDSLLKETPYNNKGRASEYIIFNYFGIEGYTPDTIPFYEDGDITIDGIKFQIKFQSSSIVNEKTLEKCKKIFRKKS